MKILKTSTYNLMKQQAEAFIKSDNANTALVRQNEKLMNETIYYRQIISERDNEIQELKSKKK